MKAAFESDADKPSDIAQREGIDFAIKAVEAAIEKVKSARMKGPYFVNPSS